MKTWLFALLQSIIATLGLTAFFLADNVLLASSAAVLAALLGVAQPLLSAHRSRQLKMYTDQQWNRSLDAVDDQLKTLLEDVIDPPFPHRATIAVAIQNRFGDRAADLIDRYDKVVTSIIEGGFDSQALVSQFVDQVKPWSVGHYLQGLAALSSGGIASAHEHFCAAKESQGDWVLPWLGWATTAYRQERWNELRGDHPHVCGVELLPYDAGDEATFLALSSDEREELSNLFQRAATSLGSYYTIAEFCNSKQQIAASRDAYDKVA